MQIIESSYFGVRSAVIRLEGGDDSPHIILFPMIHVAASSFYEEVSDRLVDCDVVLCEGVKSPTASLLTLSYRFFAQSPRLGLVSQQALKLDHLSERLVHADVTGEDFEKRWAQLPIGLRLFRWVVAPLVGLYLRYFGTRAVIARFLNLNLRKSRRDILEDEGQKKVRQVIVDWRDRHLLDVIDGQRRKYENSGASIAVLFGASHMRAVIRHLIDNCGYRVAKAEWITVFSL